LRGAQPSPHIIPIIPTESEAEVLRLRQSIETQMRRRILEAIELVLEEEPTEAARW